ncbi:MAG: hypothetical protein KatS3mg004_3059 [Bryobacteraceae bacterium]|nr:MAG: hypothetical protein KatS3mg004_3059 [Bryobacteraceae bacterium]
MAQPRPHLAVALAVEGRFPDRAPGLADELLIAVARLRAAPSGQARRGMQAAPLIERRPRQAPSLQHPSPPVAALCGARPGAAHFFHLHLRYGFSPSMRRMRSRSSSSSIARSAMTDFIRRPCSSTRSSCRILSPSSPAARKAPRHWRQGRRRDAIPAARGLQIRAAEQLQHQAHLALGRTTALAAAAGFRPRFNRPPGSLRGPGIRLFRVGHTASPYRKSVSEEIVGRGTGGCHSNGADLLRRGTI